MNVPLFSTIKSFVSDLNEIYGHSHHSLALYNRLLSKTSIDDEEAVQSHINIFTEFVKENKEGIVSRDEKGIVKQKVSYSKNVCINIRNLINISDGDTKRNIWRHLLVLSAYLDPTSGAKEVLKSSNNKVEAPSGDTGDFLNSMVGTLQDSIDVDGAKNPMDIFNQIMKSGAFSQVLNMVNSSMESGNLDIGQLMGMAQGMMGGLEGGASGVTPPDLNSMFSQLGLNTKEAESTNDTKEAESTNDTKEAESTNDTKEAESKS